jgi:hypothetical protein
MDTCQTDDGTVEMVWNGARWGIHTISLIIGFDVDIYIP